MAGTEATRSLEQFVDRVAAPLRRLLDRPPPPLPPAGIAEIWGLATQALGLRRLGARDLRQVLRVLAMPAGDWLGDLGVEPVRAEALAGSALLGSFHGPRSPGSAARLLLRAAAEGQRPAGGPPALVEALVRCCVQLGVELSTATPVTAVCLEADRATAVETADGRRVAADAVLATCDPRNALLRLLPGGTLGIETTRRLAGWRCRGTAAKVHLVLARPLCEGGTPLRSVRLGGGAPEALERAFDAVKYGEMSTEPFLEVVQPSVHESGWAPAGKHVASVLVGYVPHALRGGWDEAAVALLLARVLDRLERFDPGIRDQVEVVDVWTPLDLERRMGLSGGHLSHGEEGLDQLFFMRPAPELARYATPVPGYFLGGAGSHPGGGLTGMPGWLAAGTLLRAAA
jgi:phytoene dehydrogenase-like protein